MRVALELLAEIWGLSQSDRLRCQPAPYTGVMVGTSQLTLATADGGGMCCRDLSVQL